MTLHHFFPWLTEADIAAHQTGLQRMHSALSDDNERYRCSAHLALTDMAAEPSEWADILDAWLCGFYTVQADRVFGLQNACSGRVRLQPVLLTLAAARYRQQLRG